MQGGERVWRGVKEGLSGIVARPLQGAREDGVPGFLLGIGRGAVGAVAAPVAGVFGAVSAVSGSVDANLKYWDARPLGRRRKPRWAHALQQQRPGLHESHGQRGSGGGNGEGYLSSSHTDHPYCRLLPLGSYPRPESGTDSIDISRGFGRRSSNHSPFGNRPSPSLRPLAKIQRSERKTRNDKGNLEQKSGAKLEE